ncbi:MAG: metallophosphoesterase [Candidatus Hydrogenedentes bacterium]|nr:metallophosphoesterase [Candidatus Hydrogenedentota bacterium]
MAEQLSDTTHVPKNTIPKSSNPPLSARAGSTGKKRLERERLVRGLGVGKDETATAGIIFTSMVYGIQFLLKAMGLYGRGLRNARKLRLVHHDIAVVHLPEDLEGFRILHISDFHFPRRFPDFSEAVGNLLEGLEVDLCVLTGDYRYGYFGPADHIAPHLHTALRGVKSQHGIYAILGNHDRFITGQLLEESGFSILYNEGIPLQHKDTPFWLCGVDDPHFYKCDDLRAALQNRPEGLFTLLLAHSPECIPQAAAEKVSLYLAGHTHGGQIRLPHIGAVIANARCTRSQIWGPWHYKNMAGHTTAGIGATDIPVRYNCPPEAVVLTLRPAAPGNNWHKEDR